MYRSIITAFAALLAAACVAPTGPGEPQRPEPPADRDAIAITRLRAEPYSLEYYSGMKDSTRLTVRTQAELEQAWAAIYRGHGYVPPLPQANFAREVMLVAALGERWSGGHSIFVDSAYQRTGYLEVVIRKEFPGKRCGASGAFTQPVDVARIPVTDQPLRFRERTRAHDCG